MNTGEALKTLVDAGLLTKEKAQEIENKAAAAELAKRQQEKINKVREVAVRAVTDYIDVLCPTKTHEENKKFISILFKELEEDMKEIERDPIKEFLKMIGAA